MSRPQHGPAAPCRRGRLGRGRPGPVQPDELAVGLFVAREPGPPGWGFSFARDLPLRANASRGLATDPLVVRFSDVPTGSWRLAAAAATATAAVVGAIVGLGCVVAAALLDGAVRSAFLSLGLVLPGLLLQDSRRYVFRRAPRPRRVPQRPRVDADPGAVPRRRHLLGRLQVQWFVFAWGGAAVVAGLVGAAQAGILPRLGLVGRWHRTHRTWASGTSARM